MITKITKKIMRHLVPFCTRLTLTHKGSIKEKFTYYKYAKLAQNSGVVDFRIDRVADEFTKASLLSGIDAEYSNLLINKGINPSRGKLCGITKDNISDYLSEFDFYNLDNYFNPEFSRWYDDKLSTYYLLSPYKDHLPIHYYYVYCIKGKQKFYDLTGELSTYGDFETSILKLLDDVHDLAFKKCSGGHGDGFIKLSKHDDKYYKNDNLIGVDEVSSILKKIDGYLVTQFVKPRQDLRRICGENSFAVLRVITVYSSETASAEVIATIIRLGTSISGPTQAEHDHIYAGVNLDDGTIYDPIYEINDYEYYHTDIHPETSNRISGYKIPNLDSLKSLACNIACYLPMTPYLVFDIIPSDIGFSILEINSHGQPFIVEPYYKIKKNPRFNKLFKIDY